MELREDTDDLDHVEEEEGGLRERERERERERVRYLFSIVLANKAPHFCSKTAMMVC